MKQKMIFYNRQEAVRQMDEWGSRREPFLFVVDYRQEQIYLGRLAELSPDEVLYRFGGNSNAGPSGGAAGEAAVYFRPDPQSFESYRESFRTVVRHIRAGNSYLVNLTCCTPVETNLTLEEIFRRADAPYKLCLAGRFVVFSPEIFVRIGSDGIIRSFPMKGTIDACLPGARERILADAKEAAEHATIVDLIRNDLSMVASGVCVPRYRYIDEVKTHDGRLLQVSSEVRGQLPADWRSQLGTLFFRLLPAGSVTGAPKRKTLEIIAEAETYERGFYTGVMGVFDGSELDSAVMIRFIERQEDGRLCFKSGGGITSKSDAESEYKEMIQKIYVPIY